MSETRILPMMEIVLLIVKVSTSVSLDACGYWKTMERQYGR